MELRAVIDDSYPIIDMVHLPPLPWAPRFDGDREAIAEGGVDAVMVVYFGDAPYHPDDVPNHVVASMTALTRAVREVVDLLGGVNVLQNDAEAAIAVAAATGTSFGRVNVNSGRAGHRPGRGRGTSPRDDAATRAPRRRPGAGAGRGRACCHPESMTARL